MATDTRPSVEGVKKIGYLNKLIKKRHYRCKKRNSTKQMSSQNNAPLVASLPNLFVSCKDVFQDPDTVPSPTDVQKLCNILDNMKPEAVGLSSELEFFKATGAPKETPRVTYTTIYQCDKFSLCMFFLPQNAVIPLHNHPGMTVFSKLLLGTMHIKSYDWVYPPLNSETQPSPQGQGQARLAELKTDAVFTAPCDTSVLYPTTGGNLHEFTAITPCAVLDVIGPPYSIKDDRDCSYYKEFPYSLAVANADTEVKDEASNKYRWLKEIELPEESYMDGIEYLGPGVIDD